MNNPTSDVAYRQMITGDRFYYGAEVVTTRGFTPTEKPAKLLGFAEALLADPHIGWISVTDNPGGGPMLPPDWLAGLLAEHNRRVVVHLTCKDLNRNGIETAAWRYAAEGCNNILALTGDYPTMGFGGAARPVFDIDSVAMISLLRSMNEGLVVPGRRGKMETLPTTDFFIGCAVSPFKRQERELIPQYFKLVSKIAAGAQWIIAQLGYDMRKFNEIKLLLESRGLDVPVIGNVYLLTE
ncbi:MAG: methylenetetrahydrofolate reductase, partial [Thermoguttaceae bacterium]